MRQWFLIPVACFAASVSVVLAQGAAPAAATGKVDVQWKCTPPNPMNAVPVPDSADHAYIVESFNCTATKGEIGGVKQKSGTATDFMEATGNNAKGHGVFVETLANDPEPKARGESWRGYCCCCCCCVVRLASSARR